MVLVNDQTGAKDTSWHLYSDQTDQEGYSSQMSKIASGTSQHQNMILPFLKVYNVPSRDLFISISKCKKQQPISPTNFAQSQ